MFDDNLITIYSIKEGDIIYIPDSMCAYRQHLDSSWNERNEIEKAYVNMMLYQEASRILPNMKRQCFYRCNGVFKVFYRYRNEDLTLNKDLKFKVTNKMYQDSVKYKDASLRFKLVYLIRYFLPSHMGKIVALKKKINQRRFKYL